MSRTLATDVGLGLVMTGPGPLFLARRDTDRTTDRHPLVLRVAVDSTVLQGWHTATTALRLLTLVASPSVVPPFSAAQHAARTLEDQAPGTAALCGLARALHLSRQRSGAMVDEVRQAAAAFRHPSRRVAPVAAEALGALLRLTATVDDDPAVLAPLFLRLYRLPAGAEVEVPDGVPVVVLDGQVDIAPPAHTELVVGGLTGRLRRERDDVRRFTDALRPAAPGSPDPWRAQGATTPAHRGTTDPNVTLS